MDKFALKAKGFIDLEGKDVSLHSDEVLLVENGLISGFQQEGELPQDCPVLKFTEAYILPGLVDIAFLPHLMFGEDGAAPDGYGEAVWRAIEASESWLSSGVTSAATLGAAERLDFDLKECIKQNKLTGPRTFSALTPLVPAGANNFSWLYGVREVSGPDDARRATREVIKQGADRIILYADVPLRFYTDPQKTCRERLSFSLEELKEIVTQAHYAGCFVHAQAISKSSIQLCAMAGVRSIGCAFQLGREDLPLLKENRVALAPNLALGASIQEFGATAGLSESMIAMVAAQRIPGQLLLEARNQGIEIICGTNAVFLAGNAARECLCLEATGFSREEVLRSATVHSASSIKPFVQTGSFAAGRLADLLVLRGNPLDDLNNLSNIEKIMLGGKFVDRRTGGAN